MIAPHTVQVAKNVAITDYLAFKGIRPVSQHGQRLVYYSPFRPESTPSFWVNTVINRYKDFGASETGDDVIQLVQQLNSCSFAQAVQELNQLAGLESKSDFSFSGPIRTPITQTVIRSVKLLSNTQLVRYVESRKISFPTARRYCKEIYYQQGEKNLFALGFANDKGGYVLRNGVGAKRNIGPASYTLIAAQQASNLNLFEGVFDFLSALEYYRLQSPTFPTVVLNSTTNLESAFPLLKKYERVNAYLDNDTAGRTTLERLSSTGICVVDHSTLYAGHKDFNEFWLESPLSHSTR
ncbi:toprim domain-containing protein [Spirosoma endbachense]|uniref:Mobilization protein n=1 Tax=Spirosoma endbachense TaxID=2666025 RepID=A0A6P1W5I5_9BACT|nr:toprim domain-containing protein [Spirosoma endbachense]QHV99297.1 mobilization protein [Spirosoma endbachense]